MAKRQYTVEVEVLPYYGAPESEARPVLRITDVFGEKKVERIMPEEEWQPIADKIAERVRHRAERGSA